MNDYLDNLVARTLQLAPVVRPRLPSLFEPLSAAAGHAINASPPAETIHEHEPSRTIHEPSRTIHEDQTSRPAAPEGFRDMPLMKPPAQPAAPAKFETGSRAAKPKTMLADTSKEPGSLRGEIRRPDQPTLPAEQIFARVISQTTRPEAQLIRSVTAKVAQRPGPEGGAKPSVSESEVFESSERSRFVTPLIVPDHSPGERLSPSRRDLVETTAMRALASRVSGSAMRSDHASRFPTPNEGTPSPAPETPPSISVTIGRVDVRAVFPQPQAQRARRAHPAPMSLDEYLKQRSEGRK